MYTSASRPRFSHSLSLSLPLTSQVHTECCCTYRSSEEPLGGQRRTSRCCISSPLSPRCVEPGRSLPLACLRVACASSGPCLLRLCTCARFYTLTEYILRPRAATKGLLLLFKVRMSLSLSLSTPAHCYYSARRASSRLF